MDVYPDSSASSWPEVLNQLSDRARREADLGNASVVNAVKKAKKWEDRIRVVQECIWIKRKIINWISQCSESKYGKTGGMASKLRDEGNLKFSHCNTLESLKLYTQSVICSPEIGPELSLAFANRSAALYRLDKFETCLADIELAFKYKYAKNLAYKLHLRRGQCQVKLGNYIEAREALKLAEETLVHAGKKPKELARVKHDIKALLKETNKLEEQSQNMKNCTSQQLTSKDEHLPPELPAHATIPGAAQNLELHKDPVRGRHVITSAKVRTGDVLFSERPFSSVQIAEHYATHCHHCYERFPVPIACLKCTQPRYCSEVCRAQSWDEYHRFECGNLDIMHGVGLAHLALRTIIRAGRKQMVEEVEPYINKSTMSLATKLKSGYCNVLNLVEHSSQFHDTDLFQYSVTAVLLATFLEQRTNFFDPSHDDPSLVNSFRGMSLNKKQVEVSEDTLNFVGALILKHIVQLVCNASAIYEVSPEPGTVGMSEVKEGSVFNTQQQRIATAIYPGASMMNHSCDPTVINSFDKDRIIIKAIKDLKPGQEVFNCYGPHFRRHPLEERKQHLRTQYFFSCQCQACADPGYNLKGYDTGDRYLCLTCNSGTVGSCNSDCNRCGKPFAPDDRYNQMLRQSDVLFNMALKYEANGDFKGAISQLEQSLTMRQKLFHSSSPSIADNLDMLAKSYANLGMFQKSASYLEQAIEITKDRFGENSIEVAHELLKLGDIYLGQLREKSKPDNQAVNKARKNYEKAHFLVDLYYGAWHPLAKSVRAKIRETNLIAN